MDYLEKESVTQIPIAVTIGFASLFLKWYGCSVDRDHD